MQKTGPGGSREPAAAALGPGDPGHLYAQAVEVYGAALARLVRGYESVPHRRQELLQDVHVQLWRSFAHFDGRCSLRTWVYRVAHNTALKHVARARRAGLTDLISLEDAPDLPGGISTETQADTERAREQLAALILRLKPLDRQVILLYLEDWSADGIAQLSGLSPGHVATKIHRIKQLLARMFHGVSHE